MVGRGASNGVRGWRAHLAVVAMGFLFRVYLPLDRALTALLSVGRRVAMKVLRLATRVFMALATRCAAKVLNAESEAQPFVEEVALDVAVDTSLHGHFTLMLAPPRRIGVCNAIHPSCMTPARLL